MAKYKVRTKDCHLIVKVKLSLREKLDDSQMTLFLNKNIRGMLKAKRLNKKSVEYFGPIGISLYERLKKPVGKYDFLFIIEQIVDIFQKLNINSLVPGYVVLDIKNVFINETTKEVQFLYLPRAQAPVRADVTGFMESIIYSVISAQEEDTDYVSRFVYFIRGLNGFDAERIEKYIYEEDRNVVNTIKRHCRGMTGRPWDTFPGGEDATALLKEVTELSEHEESTRLLVDGEATGLLKREAAEGLTEEATGLLIDEEATGLLREGNGACRRAVLRRVSTGELISISKPVFRIGREKKYSDYFVDNNDKVGSSHADIITRGMRYFVMDLGSKNKTRKNEEELPARQEVEIYDGDRLKLANEEFEFKI